MRNLKMSRQLQLIFICATVGLMGGGCTGTGTESQTSDKSVNATPRSYADDYSKQTTALSNSPLGAVPEVRDAIQKGQSSVNNSTVTSMMRSVQMASELFAQDHNGTYASNPDDLRSYIAKEAAKRGDGGISGLVNPFTKAPSWPSYGSVSDVKIARSSPPPPMAPGTITYNVLSGGKSYAIMGGGADGKAMRESSGETRVYSNQ